MHYNEVFRSQLYKIDISRQTERIVRLNEIANVNYCSYAELVKTRHKLRFVYSLDFADFLMGEQCVHVQLYMDKRNPFFF